MYVYGNRSTAACSDPSPIACSVAYRLFRRLGPGVAEGQATRFTIEKESGTGVINLATDGVYLKVGSRYCGLQGSGHGQQLVCTFGSRSGATVFQFPASNYASVQLVNALSNNTCGGDFYAMYNNPPLVTCRTPFTGIAPNLTVALRTPGSPAISAGAEVALKVHEDLYTYNVGVWKTDANKRVISDSIDPSTKSPAQWFSVLPVSGGGPLANGAAVALRSSATGQFCGVSGREQPAMMCDRAGPPASLPIGYRYTYLSSPASLRPWRPLGPHYVDSFPPTPAPRAKTG
ncbi:hypothetical protein GPECTOR_20g534 [Gonium pectorale]|uniref:Uncharacterized protein n=1 Tax=Gonium pectorale TaxID=33097 RepID=A0A150GIN6_GONPE|nr:hypothetical protein GPECTOR_20g534 [Gonium pectorale]|eukprot:KXZ49677.1 hypothetical protein GPECTOR_20g534 [Gonium pectorale]